MVPVPTMHIQAHLEMVAQYMTVKNNRLFVRRFIKIDRKDVKIPNEKGSVEKICGLHLQTLTISFPLNEFHQ